MGGEGGDGGVDGDSSICFYWEVNLFFFLGFVSAFFGSRGVGGALFGGGGVGRMVEGDGESCGSRAGEDAAAVGGAEADVGDLQRGAPAAPGIRLPRGRRRWVRRRALASLRSPPHQVSPFPVLVLLCFLLEFFFYFGLLLQVCVGCEC